MEYFGRIGRVLVNNDDENRECDEHVKGNLLRHIDEVREFISGFRAPATLAALEDLRHGFTENPCTERDIGHFSHQIFDRFQAEVGDQWLIIVNYEHSGYLDEDVAPFGDAVRDKFPRLSEDIDEAAKCLALSRYTACVFHLMRVMESSVHLLARKLNISIDLRIASWNDVTIATGNALSAMPGKTPHNRRKKQLYGEALANLTAVRIAWRNEVMHPKKTYTRVEAAKIFSHVEGFLESLVPIA